MGVFYYTTPGEYEVTASYNGVSSEPTTVTVKDEMTITQKKDTLETAGT